jgi:hypothetical protein
MATINAERRAVAAVPAKSVQSRLQAVQFLTDRADDLSGEQLRPMEK